MIKRNFFLHKHLI